MAEHQSVLAIEEVEKAWECLERDAAALAALREPSDAVVEAAYDEAAGHVDEHLTEAKIRAALRAAVEAAEREAGSRDQAMTAREARRAG